MMDFEQAALGSGIIPPDKVGSLLASLKKVPDFSWVLSRPHPSELRLQGDALADFPLAIIDETGNARSTKLTVLVLNNTCDLQPNRAQFVTVAPTFDFERFAESVIKKRGEHRAQSYLHEVRANNIYEVLWLPSFGQFKGGAVVFLERVGAVSVKLYEEALSGQRRLASFSQNGFYFLLIKLTNHIARLETDEVARSEVV